MMDLARTVLSLAGGPGLNQASKAASDALPSPTVLVVVFAAMWLGLVACIAWLATSQHRLDAEAQSLGRQLQARLDRDDRRARDDRKD
jgi:hypothetical protein